MVKESAWDLERSTLELLVSLVLDFNTSENTVCHERLVERLLVSRQSRAVSCPSFQLLVSTPQTTPGALARPQRLCVAPPSRLIQSDVLGTSSRSRFLRTRWYRCMNPCDAGRQAGRPLNANTGQRRRSNYAVSNESAQSLSCEHHYPALGGMLEGGA